MVYFTVSPSLGVALSTTIVVVSAAWFTVKSADKISPVVVVSFSVAVVAIVWLMVLPASPESILPTICNVALFPEAKLPIDQMPEVEL